MAMIDLKPNYLKKVKSILAAHVPECDVMAYGSRTGGSAKAHSYLDLAVMGEIPLSAPRLANLSLALNKAGFQFKVEVVDWAATGKDFRKVIKRTSVSIQISLKK